MAVVTVQPLGIAIEVPSGQTVMAAAYSAGYDWPTECGGVAECGTCVSIIREGIENCGPMPQDEADALQRTMGVVDPTRRLACRLTVLGPVTLTKRGVRPAEGDTP